MLISKIVHFIVICSLKITLMQTATSVRGKRKQIQLKILMVCHSIIFYPHGHKLKTKQIASRFNFGRGGIYLLCIENSNVKRHVANWQT